MSSEPIGLVHKEDSVEGVHVLDLDVDEETGTNLQGWASGSVKRKRPLKSQRWQYFEMLPEVILLSLFNAWGIQRKVFTITLDNAVANDVFVGLLRDHLSLNCSLVNGGEYFHVRCCAHILNLIVQEGLKIIDHSVDKIRECVKHVKGSKVRKKKFVETVTQTSLDAKKSLRQDVPTRWNSTYLMLSSAIYYRRAFNHLKLTDTNFTHCPLVDECGQAEKICKFLEVFYETTTLFSGMKYPTANLYFPCVFTVQLTLSQALQSSDDFMRSMANRMFQKFDKY
ncbi:zinc finger BED domain-containing protein RICESLEEPER 2-like [Primulina tabacum]|uniref:zinc finger BED domain-containing protein RICESLEEPER 2-like n=1 Tax=Primulina tabacum TaxID=48773 RepID=UPI003F5967B0